MKPALLVIDVQKQFFAISPETTASLNQAIPFINEAIDFFRENCLCRKYPRQYLAKPVKAGIEIEPEGDQERKGHIRMFVMRIWPFLL